jgi:anti-anti-sigma factor
MDAHRSTQFIFQSGIPRVTGDLDMANAADLERFLTNLGPDAAGVDFSGVTFFDSSALRVLLRCLKQNADLRILNPSSKVARILEMTQTHDLLRDNSLQGATE